MSEEDRSLNAAIAAHASWANTSNRTARHIASAEIPPASRVTRRAQPDALGSDLAWTWRKVSVSGVAQDYAPCKSANPWT